MSDEGMHDGAGGASPSAQVKTPGTKLSGIVDDLVNLAARDVKSWLDATEAACSLSRATNMDILRALAKSRGKTIADDLELLSVIRSTFSTFEHKRVALRAKLKQAIANRNAAGILSFRRAVIATDDVIIELLECERRRADLIGDATRIALRSQASAKELYGQISALTGNGRIEKVVGLKEVGFGDANNG